jgi:thioesterase domain-containing protein
MPHNSRAHPIARSNDDKPRSAPITDHCPAPAAVLAQDTAPQFSRLVQLKSGTDAPCVFIAAGIGGDVMDLSVLVKSMSCCCTIYGFDTKEINETASLPNTIDGIANDYIESLHIVQSRGPYYLVGYSFGGLIMMEVARCLLAAGEVIALLVFLDTYPHQRFLPLKFWFAGVRRIANKHALVLMRLPAREVISYLWLRLRRFVEQIRARYLDASQERSAGGDRETLAFLRYRPRYYPGKIIFLGAEIPTGFVPADPIAIWSNLAESLEVHTIPGDHIGMTTTHTESLATELSLCIRRALIVSDRK